MKIVLIMVMMLFPSTALAWTSYTSISITTTVSISVYSEYSYYGSGSGYGGNWDDPRHEFARFLCDVRKKKAERDNAKWEDIINRKLDLRLKRCE